MSEDPQKVSVWNDKWITCAMCGNRYRNAEGDTAHTCARVDPDAPRNRTERRMQRFHRHAYDDMKNA